MMLFNHTLAIAGNMKMEHHEEKQIEEHEDDLDFESIEFAETASYQIVSPSNKGFFIAALFTGSMWGVFIFLFFNMKKGSGSMP